MSLYNEIHGVERMAPMLLELLNLPLEKIPRFRDCYLGMDEGERRIILYTRTGGGNREAYEDQNAYLRTIKGFLRDYDDDFDSTFAYFVYAIPEEHKADLEQLSLPPTPREKFDKLMADLKSGTETPTTKRALKIGEQITKALQGNGPKIIKI